MTDQQPKTVDAEPEESGAALRTENISLNKVIFVLGISIALMHIYFNIFALLPSLLQNSLHYAGFALMCALLYPFIQTKNPANANLILVLDVLFGLIAAGTALYMISMEDAIYERGVKLSTAEWICGVILILSAIEGVKIYMNDDNDERLLF